MHDRSTHATNKAYKLGLLASAADPAAGDATMCDPSAVARVECFHGASTADLSAPHDNALQKGTLISTLHQEEASFIIRADAMRVLEQK